jgi:hypothetical protein
MRNWELGMPSAHPRPPNSNPIPIPYPIPTCPGGASMVRVFQAGALTDGGGVVRHCAEFDGAT